MGSRAGPGLVTDMEGGGLSPRNCLSMCGGGGSSHSWLLWVLPLQGQARGQQPFVCLLSPFGIFSKAFISPTLVGKPPNQSSYN